MPRGEPAVVPLRPAVQRDAVLPDTQVQAAAPEPVGRHLIRHDQHHVRAGGHDQRVYPVEQRAVRPGAALDVVPRRSVVRFRIRHHAIMAGRPRRQLSGVI